MRTSPPVGSAMPANDGTIHGARPVPRRLMVVGAAATLGIAGIGVLIRPGPGGALLFGLPDPVEWRAGRYIANAAGWLCVAVLVTCWLLLVRLARAGGLSVRSTGWTIGAWSLPLALGPALFSSDIFSYAAQGQLAARGMDPYSVGPLALGESSRFYQLSDPFWKVTPTPYGPVWVGLTKFFALISGQNPAVTVSLLRITQFVSVAVIAVTMVELAKRLDADPATVLAIGVANPIFMLHLISGGHNDGLMLALLLFGLLLAIDQHRVLASIVVGCAVAVKLPAAAGIIFIGWGWFGPVTKVWRRVLGIALAGAISTAVVALWSWGTGLGWGWINTAVTSPTTLKTKTSPTVAFALIIRQLARLMGVHTRPSQVVSPLAVVGVVMAIVACGVIIFRAREAVSVVSLGLALLAVAMLGPTLYPWYIVGAIGLLAFAQRPWKIATLVVLSAVLALVVLPSGSGILQRIEPFGSWVMPVVIGVSVGIWWRRHRGLDPASPVPAATEPPAT